MAASAAAVLASDAAGALQYGPSEGYRPLREWVALHLEETTGQHFAPEQILITNGSQQGLDLIGKTLLDPGDAVLAENPAYLGALQAFSAYEPHLVGLPTDSEGMDADALRQWFLESRLGTGPCPKIVYIVPRFQNPTGTSTSPRRLTALAALAAAHDATLILDDPYGALAFADTAPLGSGQPLSLCEIPVPVYLGSFSKVLAPGLRVGWMAIRDGALYDRVLVAKQASDLHTGSLTQRIVQHFVAQPGRLDRHVASLRAVYRERRDTMLRALERHLPAGTRWTIPGGGLFIWADLPDGIDTEQLLAAAIRRRVAFVPGAPFWIGCPRRSSLRLNFSNATPARIEEGLRRMGEAIRAWPG